MSGINVSFMLDTGASVSLLRANVWEKNSSDEVLLQWNGSRLVGVEGSSVEIFFLCDQPGWDLGEGRFSYCKDTKHRGYLGTRLFREPWLCYKHPAQSFAYLRKSDITERQG